MAQSLAPNDQRVAERPVMGNSGFVVVNQAPSRTESFPYRLHDNWILAFSIPKCIFGVLLFLTGIVLMTTVPMSTMDALAVPGGLTIIGSAIIGMILKCKQNKCLIGAFLGLSITSLIFDISMLGRYGQALDYYIKSSPDCFTETIGEPKGCRYASKRAKQTGIGISAFLVSIVVLELGCSIGSVIVSAKAFCKFCNTCDVNDCGTCLGCCECDCQPLNVQQRNQANASPAHNYQNFQMSPMQPGNLQPIPNKPQFNTNFQSHPCSGIVSLIVNIPAYVFGSANGIPMSPFNATVQAVSPSQQIPGSEPSTSAEQVQVTSVGGVD